MYTFTSRFAQSPQSELKMLRGVFPVLFKVSWKVPLSSRKKRNKVCREYIWDVKCGSNSQQVGQQYIELALAISNPNGNLHKSFIVQWLENCNYDLVCNQLPGEWVPDVTVLDHTQYYEGLCSIPSTSVCSPSLNF